MNEIEIEVINSELPQRIVKGPLDVLRGVELAGKLIRMSAYNRETCKEVTHTDLRGEPKFLTGNPALLDSLTDLLLVLVDPSIVDVPVPGLQRGEDGLPDLIRPGLPDAWGTAPVSMRATLPRA